MTLRGQRGRLNPSVWLHRSCQEWIQLYSSRTIICILLWPADSLCIIQLLLFSVSDMMREAPPPQTGAATPTRWQWRKSIIWRFYWFASLSRMRDVELDLKPNIVNKSWSIKNWCNPKLSLFWCIILIKVSWIQSRASVSAPAWFCIEDHECFMKYHSRNTS